ncbi:MAG: hypothetical protein JWL76_1358 [Thermoleophilia bacterium]|nr:hypothetical protein [Thermoleophilia bacterium]
MQGVQGHVHGGGAGVRRAVDGGGQADEAGQAEQKPRGRKKRKHKHGGAGEQGATGAKALKGGGAGAITGDAKISGATTAGGGAGGMAGCGAMTGATTGEATLGAPTAAGLAALPTDAQDPAAGAQGALGAPAAPAAAAAAPSPLIQSALGEVGSSPLASQVLQSLATNGARIETVSDAQMASQFGERTKGAFDPKTNSITLPESVAKNPAELRLVLFHEGVHWLQDNVKGGAEALGGPIGNALQSAGAVRQTSGAKDDLQHDEAQAYVLEAMLANQLGIKDSGLGVDSSGRALSYGSVLQRVKQTAEYA